MSDFTHLHVHSDGSPLDGMSPPAAYVKKAKELGQPALAVTDHGVLSALPEFYREAKKQGILPILGLETYWTPKIDKSSGKKQRPSYNHLTVLAKGRTGYRVLCELATEAYRNFYYRPPIDRDTLLSLGDDLKHLVILSGCFGGPLAQAAKVGQDALEEELSWWLDVCPNYYIELMEHGIPEERSVNTRLLKAAKKYRVPVVFTNDPHFCNEDQSDFHDTLLAIQTGSQIGDESRFRFDGYGYWMRSEEEMVSAFAGYPQWAIQQGLSNSGAIARDCQAEIPEWDKTSWRIPQVPGIPDPYQEILTRVRSELKRRRLPRVYWERAKEELRVIKKMDVSGFLLVAADGVAWARSQGIVTGTGRGSVGGCLVASLLDIHRVDPIKNNLRFDRFLNPERPRMPDIDIDFQKSRRDEMFDYARERFGEENVMNVCTFMRMRLKRAFRALAKSYGIPFQKTNELAALLPDDDEDEMSEDRLPEELVLKYPELAAQLEAFRNIRCGFGSHPAGVVISPSGFKLSEQVPQMFLASSKRWVAQYDMSTFEAMGLLKQDYLGLRTLDTVAETVRLVKNRTGEDVDPFAFDTDNETFEPDMYKMLASGKTGGVFQFEGNSVTDGARELQPECFADLAACIALYRKGPIQAGSTGTFVKNRRKDPSEVKYLHESLRPILAPTYGALVYQESVMDIGEQICGFSPGANDDLLRAVAKKKADLMAKIGPSFIEACIEKSGFTQDAAEKFWEQISKQAEYMFNGAHSAGYAHLAYTTAALKTLYPLEFYCALLRTMPDTSKDAQKKRTRYLKEAATSGLRILPADVNRSDALAVPDYESNGIRFGLSDIKGVGLKTAQKIIDQRPKDGYLSPPEVSEVVRNSKMFRALVDAGALYRLGMNPDKKKIESLMGWPLIDTMKKFRVKYKDKYRPPDQVIGEIVRTSINKTKAGKPYCSWVIRWSPTEEWGIRLWSSCSDLYPTPVGSIICVRGEYQDYWRSISVRSVNEVKVIKVPRGK